MKVLQLIYTSCKKGLSPGAGFQTYSMSEGISEEERREIERYGLYVPPTNLPTQPGPEEIETLFPVALRFFRLKSGRYGICQSKYIGRDYSGRYGNYFCHALIPENGHFPVYPIQFYHSPLFRDHLSQEETQVNVTPPPLPILDLEAAEGTSCPEIHLDQVLEFINNTRIEQVKELVSAAITYDETHRSLILSDSSANIPYWIAALQMAFPLELAHNLTFATYIHDPAGMNTMISGVPREGSRFAFSETQRNFENYIFDFEHPGTPVMDKEYDFSKNIDLGYTISKESLVEFHQFINLFDFNRINKELDSISHLFQVSRVGLDDLTTGQILAAVEFANQYASPGVLSQLADSFLQILDGLTSNVDFKSAEIITKFLFKIARQSPEKRHLETAYTFFFQALDHLIIHNPQPHLESTENLYSNIRDENIPYGEEFAKRTLSGERLKQITRSISHNGDSLRSGIYFNLIVGTIISFQYTWEFMMENHPVFQSFIQNSFAALMLTEDNLRGALKTAGKDNDFFVEFIAFCLTHLIKAEEKRAIFLNNYINVMENKTTDSAVSIRLNLIRYGHSQFIYEEYFNLLHDAPDKPKFFWTYFNSIFRKANGFREEYFDTAVNQYLDLLWDKDLFKECEKLIDHETLITSPTVIERVILEFERGLAHILNDEAKLNKVFLVLEIKKKRKITTAPDITRLIYLGIQCEKAAVGLAAVKIPEIIKSNSDAYSLKQLDSKSVTEYFRWCFPNLVRLVKSPKDHDIVFQWFGNSKLDKIFVLEYIEEIKGIIKKDHKSGIENLLNFLKFYLSQFLDNEAFLIIREKSRGSLVKILSKLPKPRFSYIREVINRYVGRGTKAEYEWKRILEYVKETQGKSFFGLVKRAFGKDKRENATIDKSKSKKIKNLKQRR